MNKRNNIIALICNIIIFSLAIFCLVFFLTVGDAEETHRFRYYTNLSNLLVGLTSAINIPFIILSLKKKQDMVPTWFVVFRFSAIMATNVTAIMVVAVLAPLTSYYAMYRDIRLVTHAILPVIAIISFLFFENNRGFKWRWSLFGMSTVLFYGTFYTIMVIGLQLWPDFYEFNRWNNWYLIYPAMQVIGFALSQGFYFLREVIRKKVLKLDK